MDAFADALRCQEGNGTPEGLEPGSLAWARQKIEEVKAVLRAERPSLSSPSTAASNFASEIVADSACGASSRSRWISSSSESGTLPARFLVAFPRAISAAPQTADRAAVAVLVSAAAEAVASATYSASCYHAIEDIWILTIV
jgi:hypothetical protein